MPDFVNPFVGVTPGRKLTLGELSRAIRLSLSAEEEATHLYEAIADATDHPLARVVLQEIANEERVHKGEFQRLLQILRPDEADLMNQGANEVNEHVSAMPARGGGEVKDQPTIGSLRGAE